MRRFHRPALKCLSTLLLLTATQAQGETRSLFELPSGNGFGFQIYDSKANRLIGFLDHPYRFLRPNADRHKDGVERRNLLEDFSLGVVTHKRGKPIWLEGLTPLQTEYVDQSNIIRSEFLSQGAKFERYFFSPFDLDANALVAFFQLANSKSEQSGVARLHFHLGANPVSPSFYQPTLSVVRLPGEKLRRLKVDGKQVWIQQGHGLGAMVYIPLQARTRALCELKGSGHVGPIDEFGTAACEGENLSLLFSAPVDAQGAFGVLIAYFENPEKIESDVKPLINWIKNRSAANLRDQALTTFSQWRHPAPASLSSEDERKLWRQSEAVLRMAQVREPNLHDGRNLRTSNGMILASLAPGHWTTGWVRDGTYATVALTRAGHLAEARAALNFFLNAEPVGSFKNYLGNFNYRISITRYYGSGEEEADYSNQATPNVETDGWGLVLWAARQYLDRSQDFSWLNQPTRDGNVYEALREGVAKAIESQIEPEGELKGIMKPDSSIWEVHQENARHFAFSSLTAARGLCDFAAIASRSGHKDDFLKFSRLAEDVRRATLKHFALASDGGFVAAVERSSETDLDASVVEFFGLDVLNDFHSSLAKSALVHLEDLKLPSGGFMRVAGSSTYQTNEWAFINYRMAGAYLRMGQKAQAANLIERMTRRSAANFYLLPELYNATSAEGAIGAYQGSNPMVGYGAGAFILAALEKTGSFEDRSCK